MIKLNFPTYDFRIKRQNNVLQIFDKVRKKYVILKNEEWVRQHIIWFLTEEKKYPTELLRVEVSVNTNILNQRSDIVAYNKQGCPIMIVECKSASVKITQDTFEQIARYNIKLKVPYLFISNGLQHYCYAIDYDNASYTFMKDIPNFNDIEEI